MEKIPGEVWDANVCVREQGMRFTLCEKKLPSRGGSKHDKRHSSFGFSLGRLS